MVDAHWVHPGGYRLVKCGETWDSCALYECTLDVAAPLEFVAADGTAYQPDRHFVSDLASIPRLLWMVPSFERDHALLSGLVHDSAYCHAGLWTRPPGLLAVIWCALDRATVDAVFAEMVVAETGSTWLSWMMWVAVRLGGGRAWARGDRRLDMARATNG